MKTRRDKLDVMFSKLVRERANWTCEFCHKHVPEESSARLDCSHFFSRRKASTRWHPDNAAAHCFTCHQTLGENPVVFEAWITGHLGKERRQEIWRLASTIRKFTKADREDIYREMKLEYARLRLERDKGYVGRLEFSLPTVEMVLA